MGPPGPLELAALRDDLDRELVREGRVLELAHEVAQRGDDLAEDGGGGAELAAVDVGDEGGDDVGGEAARRRVERRRLGRGRVDVRQPRALGLPAAAGGPGFQRELA